MRKNLKERIYGRLLLGCIVGEKNKLKLFNICKCSHNNAGLRTPLPTALHTLAESDYSPSIL